MTCDEELSKEDVQMAIEVLGITQNVIREYLERDCFIPGYQKISRFVTWVYLRRSRETCGAVDCALNEYQKDTLYVNGFKKWVDKQLEEMRRRRK